MLAGDPWRAVFTRDASSIPGPIRPVVVVEGWKPGPEIGNESVE